MKSIATLAAVALLATVSAANAQTPMPGKSTDKPVAADKPLDICVQNQAKNAETISKAQSAKTVAERQKVLKAAIDADPANATCLADMALQMQLAMNNNIQPAAGPEDVGGDTPDLGEGTPPPAENPNQLNESTDADPSSPASPGNV